LKERGYQEIETKL